MKLIDDEINNLNNNLNFFNIKFNYDNFETQLYIFINFIVVILSNENNVSFFILNFQAILKKIIKLKNFVN